MRRILSCFVFCCVANFGWCQTNGSWAEIQAQYERGQFQEAVQSVDHYLAAHPKPDSFHLAEILYLKANALYYLADYLESLTLYDETIALSPDHPAGLNLRAMALFDRAFAEYELEEYLPAYNSTRAAEDIMRQLEHPNWDYLLSIYSDLAYTATELGFFAEAETYLERGSKLLREHKDQLQLPPGAARKEVTFAYAQTLLFGTWNKEQQALAALNNLRELNLIQTFNAEEQLRYAVALNHVADMYLNFRSDYTAPFQRAHALLDQAFEALDTSRYKANYWQFTFNRAKAFRYAGQTQSALQLNQELLDNCPEDDARLPFFWAQRGLIQLTTNADSAWVGFQKMLGFIHRGPSPLKEDLSNFAPSTILNHTGLMVEIADEILEQESPPSNLKTLAAALYRLGLRQFQNCFDGHTFNAKLRTYYEKAIAGILSTGNLDRLPAKKELLQVMDNIENQLAWQRFSGNRRLRQLSAPDSLYQRQLELRQAIVQAQRTGDSPSVQALQDEIRNLEQQHFRGNSSSGLQLANLQAQLSEQQLVLKYGYFQGQLFVFGITKESIWIRPLAVSFNWEKEIATYLETLREIGPVDASAERLGAFLLPEEIENYSELFIIPCRELANLPFHALHYQSTYLIRTHAVSYAPHIVFLQATAEDRFGKQGRQNLVVAPQQTAATNYLARRGNPADVYLQGAATEARIIAELTNAKLLFGETGTKQALTEMAPQADLLHIASHAVFDAKTPNLSYLQLAQGEKLYLEEIYGLSLPTELVVLSACQTATSASFGRSLHAFHRAFFQAGTSSIIAGLWELPDQATGRIVADFYRHLKNGLDKHQALRNAYLAWLETEQEAHLHPFFWAGLVVQGDPSVVYTVQPVKPWYKLLAFVVFAILSLGLVYKFFNSRKY
ncbi:MAG: CHAT domain-containing protein [Bacteroidota bacterium]